MSGESIGITAVKANAISDQSCDRAASSRKPLSVQTLWLAERPISTADVCDVSCVYSQLPQWESRFARAQTQGDVTRGGKGGAIPRAPSHYGDAKITAGETENSQQCRKYILQYSTFAFERPQSRTWWRQTCFLPRAPSNLVTPLHRHYIYWIIYESVFIHCVLNHLINCFPRTRVGSWNSVHFVWKHSTPRPWSHKSQCFSSVHLKSDCFACMGNCNRSCRYLLSRQ